MHATSHIVCACMRDTKATYLLAMWVPDALASCARLCLDVAPTGILIGRLALELFYLGPASAQKLDCDVVAANFCCAEVARDVICGWAKRVCGGERAFLADGQCAEEFAGLKCPRLSRL